MLLPIPSSVFLCTPPHPPYACTVYHNTIEENIEHLETTHAQVDSYTTAFGKFGLRSIPTHATFLAPSILPGDQTALNVFICPCCSSYFPAESTFAQHLVSNGAAEAIIALKGEEGVLAFIRDKCRRLLVLQGQVQDADDGQDAVAAAIDAVVSIAARNPQTAIARAAAGPFRLPITAGLSGASSSLAVLRLPRRARHGRGTPNPVQALARRGVNISIKFCKPLTTGSCLITLHQPSILALIALISAQYVTLTGAEAAAVDWAGWFARGVPLRYEDHHGDVRLAVICYDRHIEACFGMIEYGEMCIGDEPN